MRASNPAVLSAIVLPPAFGPEMIKAGAEAERDSDVPITPSAPPASSASAVRVGDGEADTDEADGIDVEMPCRSLCVRSR
jgi:hypothetical protein